MNADIIVPNAVGGGETKTYEWNEVSVTWYNAPSLSEEGGGTAVVPLETVRGGVWLEVGA